MKTKFVALGLAVVALLGVTACQEDNIAEQAKLTHNGQSLWMNISNDSRIDSFAMILKNTYFLTSDYDKSLNYTYDQVLNTPQQYTVFAPVNGSYNAQAVLEQLETAKALVATDRDSARAIYRRVEEEFVRNHIVRYNVSASSSQSTQLSLLNGKAATLVPSVSFNGAALSGEGVSGNNGDLRLINGQSPYRYNLYEYIRYNPANSDYANYLLAYDTTYFSEGSSVAGALYEGQIQYIDSVYVKYNKVLGEALGNEDSTFVGLVPTNEAAADFYARYLPYIQYRNTYRTTWSVNANTGAGAFSRVDTVKVDSLRQSMARDIMRSYFAFSTRQMQIEDPNDSTQIVNYVLTADSLKARLGDYLKNLTPGQNNAIFDGFTPTRLSNGFVYSVDRFNLEPKHWLRDVSYDPVKYGTGFTILNNNNGVITASIATIDSTTADSTVALIDSITDNDYLQLLVPRGTLKVEFRLNNTIYSNTPYKIGIVTIPSKANLNVSQHENISPTFAAFLLDDQERRIKASTSPYTVDTTKVDTLWLFDDVVFPVSYVGIGVYSFPRIQLAFTRANNSLLNIDAIIVRPKELDN